MYTCNPSTEKAEAGRWIQASLGYKTCKFEASWTTGDCLFKKKKEEKQEKKEEEEEEAAVAEKEKEKEYDWQGKASLRSQHSGGTAGR